MSASVNIAVVGAEEDADGLVRALSLSNDVRMRHIGEDAVDEVESASGKPVDAVVLAVAPGRVPDLFVRTMRSGALLLLPLPPGRTVRELDRIRKSVKRYTVRAMCRHVARFRPELARMKEFVDSGVLGDAPALSTAATCSNDNLTAMADACCWLGGDVREATARVGGADTCRLRVVFTAGMSATIDVGDAAHASALCVTGPRGHAAWRPDHGGRPVTVTVEGRERVLPTVAGDPEEFMASYVLSLLQGRGVPDYVSICDSRGILELLACAAGSMADREARIEG